MGKRRRSRELALQFLYQWDFNGVDNPGPFQTFWEDRGDAEPVKAFAQALTEGVMKNRAEIDRLIEDQSRHWKLYRMNRIDRNILRMAVFEMMSFPEVPVKVSIDEAIEVGKKFGTSESGAFINGILDRICRRLGRLEPLGGVAEEDNGPPGDRDPG